jgi:phosphoribosylformylglycinamidine synthase
VCSSDLVPAEDVILEEHIMFSESNSRMIVTVDKAQQERFEHAMKGAAKACIGEVTQALDFIITGLDRQELLKISIDKLKEAWKAPLRW